MPITKLESSDARKRDGAAILRGLPIRPIGDYENEAILHFLRNAVEYRRIYPARTDDIDPDL